VWRHKTDTGVLFAGVKRFGRGADNSAEVTNEYRFSSIPPVRLHGMDRDITFFTFKFEKIYNRNGQSVCKLNRYLHYRSLAGDVSTLTSRPSATGEEYVI
jgi:hypothetical protein